MSQHVAGILCHCFGILAVYHLLQSINHRRDQDPDVMKKDEDKCMQYCMEQSNKKDYKKNQTYLTILIFVF